jgi:hypothetical protein
MDHGASAQRRQGSRGDRILARAPVRSWAALHVIREQRRDEHSRAPQVSYEQHSAERSRGRGAHRHPFAIAVV